MCPPARAHRSSAAHTYRPISHAQAHVCKCAHPNMFCTALRPPGLRHAEALPPQPLRHSAGSRAALSGSSVSRVSELRAAASESGSGCGAALTAHPTPRSSIVVGWLPGVGRRDPARAAGGTQSRSKMSNLEPFILAVFRRLGHRAGSRVRVASWVAPAGGRRGSWREVKVGSTQSPTNVDSNSSEICFHGF